MTSRSARSLHFAARPAVVAAHLATLALPLALLLLLPLGVLLASGAIAVALRLVAVVVALGLCGVLGLRIDRPRRLQENEALVITALAFVGASLALAPVLAAYDLAPIDALFESVSAMTTTGLTTLASVEGRPLGFHFLRSWMQWTGGLGVVVLALAMLVHPGSAARRLGFDGRESDELAGGTRSQARKLLELYVVLTLLGMALVIALGTGPVDAIPHVLAAISTGGFSTHDDSLAGLDGRARGALLLIAFLGAVPMPLYLRSGLRRRSFLRQGLGLLAGGIVLSAGLVLAFEHLAGRAPLASGDGLALAASAGTTTGFSTHLVGALTDASKLVLLTAMTLGGEVGSTAGGLKVLRVLILVALVRHLLQGTGQARSARIALRVGGSRVASREVEAVVSLLVTYLAVLALSWLAFVAHGYDAVDALFEVGSATGTVGLSTGLTRPALEPALKGVLCADMLFGRVEVLALLLTVLPTTWIGRRRPWH